MPVIPWPQLCFACIQRPCEHVIRERVWTIIQGIQRFDDEFGQAARSPFRFSGDQIVDWSATNG
jgi:hypothetical protein